MKTETPSFRREGAQPCPSARKIILANAASIGARSIATLTLMLAPMLAAAESSVDIGGYTFYCQNTCVVGQGASGMYVTDSQGGWVRIYSAHGRLPVPR